MLVHNVSAQHNLFAQDLSSLEQIMLILCTLAAVISAAFQSRRCTTTMPRDAYYNQLVTGSSSVRLPLLHRDLYRCAVPGCRRPWRMLWTMLFIVAVVARMMLV